MNADVDRLEKFYYHKMDGGNRLAYRYLNSDNPLGQPAAVIFFGQATLEDMRTGILTNGGLRSKSQIMQARAFVETPDQDWDTTCIVVVDTRTKAYFLKPAGIVMDVRNEGLAAHLRTADDTSTQKLMPVEIIAEKDLREIPFVLATINSNQYLARGTYRPISEKKNRGNLKAIFSVLEKPWKPEWYKVGASGLFECLSSVELETLVAKILEERGCFVPAYRGGMLKDVDLFAFCEHSIDIDGLLINHYGIKVQVKGNAQLRGDELPDGVYLIGYACKGVDSYFDERWLLNQIKRLPKVRQWLKRSLDWVPEDFIRMFL